MKNIVYWIIILVFAAACSSQKEVVKIKDNGTEVEEKDSLEFELEVLDPKFDTWYTLHDSPAQYRSQSYYENWNHQYVNAWNANALDPRKSKFFEPIVGYDPTQDYGFELNHKLFYYFLYVENVLNIEIMPGGPKSVPL